MPVAEAQPVVPFVLYSQANVGLVNPVVVAEKVKNCPEQIAPDVTLTEGPVATAEEADIKAHPSVDVTFTA